MTTPKEKALELAIKFTSTTDVVKPNKGSIKMALIAVDEVQKQAENWGIVSVFRYWQEVKQELEEL